MPKKFELIVTPVSSRYEISIWDGIDDYEDYEELLKKLGGIRDSDKVTLKVSTSGGRCSIGFMLIDRFRSLPCKVDVVVPYPTYSMGAVMALCGNSLKISKGSFLMFHDYSGGSGHKGNEILKATEAYCDIFKYRFNNICQPFLSEEECEDVLQGKDLYIKWNNPTLKERIKRHFS